MPKITDRERLAKIELDRKKLDDEADRVRKIVRGQYGTAVSDLALETLSEREFRDIIGHAIRIGGGAALAALKAIPARTP